MKKTNDLSKHVDLAAAVIHPNFFHAIMGAYLFLLLILLFCVFPYAFFGFSLISITILFFNAIFIFLVFPLKGPLFHKVSLATIGNVSGFGWEYFLGYLAENTYHYFGGLSDAVYFVVNPFLELFWIVSMWALGLSVLASRQKSHEQARAA